MKGNSAYFREDSSLFIHLKSIFSCTDGCVWVCAGKCRCLWRPEASGGPWSWRSRQLWSVWHGCPGLCRAVLALTCWPVVYLSCPPERLFLKDHLSHYIPLSSQESGKSYDKGQLLVLFKVGIKDAKHKIWHFSEIINMAGRQVEVKYCYYYVSRMRKTNDNDYSLLITTKPRMYLGCTLALFSCSWG